MANVRLQRQSLTVLQNDFLGLFQIIAPMGDFCDAMWQQTWPTWGAIWQPLPTVSVTGSSGKPIASSIETVIGYDRQNTSPGKHIDLQCSELRRQFGKFTFAAT